MIKTETKTATGGETITETFFIFSYLKVSKLGVEVGTGQLATAEDVLEEHPHVVVVGTGGVPDNLGLKEAVTVWDVLSGEEEVGGKVLVYDNNGCHAGPSCAEYLATAGKQVEIVTPDRAVATDMGALNRPVYLRSEEPVQAGGGDGGGLEVGGCGEGGWRGGEAEE